MKLRRLLAAAAAMCIALPAVVSDYSAATDVRRIKGDVNGDMVFNLADMILFQRWLKGSGELTAAPNADINEDEVCDVFDLSAMRKLLINCMNEAPVPSFKPKSQNLCAGIAASSVTGKSADESFINSQYDLTLKLFKKTYAEEETPTNTLISPYSIVQALGMTANGAAGDTRTEMENVLGGGMKIEDLNSYLLTQRLNSVNDKRNEYANKWSMNTANSIWARNDKSRINPRPEFIQNCVDFYDSEFYVAPFDETTLDDVNGWVNEKTNEMIPTILSKIDPLDVMYLVNAVAFEAEWDEPYEKHQIKDGKFTNAAGDVQDASMLCSHEKYIFDENTNGMIKYYSGGRYAFAALLPDEGTTVDEYIEKLTPEKLSGIIASGKSDMIMANVKLPKFSYEYNNELSDELKAIGMPTAFSNSADFTNMSSVADIHPLHIGIVIHKTFIDLDENGTKAAAATLVAMRDNGMPMYEDVKDVTFDRPFVYCIIDTETSLPVFIGALNSL